MLNFNALIVVAIFAVNHATSFTQLRPLTSHRANVRNNLSETINQDVETVQGAPASSSTFVVALTREEGKNDKLRKALQSNERIQQLPVQIHEIPCIEHADGPDTEQLGPTLSNSKFDYVAVTSPEAAKVLATAWIAAGRPELGKVAAVGKATQESLSAYDIDVAFVPSKATAETLVKELPLSDAASHAGRPTTLFYPASAKAKDTLQSGLEGRGFEVTRLNTYDTVPASWDSDQMLLAKSSAVACFASPSAVKAWLKNTSELDQPRAVAACIGETSAEACRKNQWEEKNIFYPDSPGVDGWAVAVADALEFLATGEE